MAKWIIIIALVISAGVLGYTYQVLQNTPIDTPIETKITATSTVNLYHSSIGGVNHWIGSIKLPHSCYTLDQNAIVDPNHPTSVSLTLVSHNHMLDTKICAQIWTKYDFDMVAESQNVFSTVSLTIDGQPLPFKMYETFSQNTEGTYMKANGATSTIPK